MHIPILGVYAVQAFVGTNKKHVPFIHLVHQFFTKEDDPAGVRYPLTSGCPMIVRQDGDER